MISVAEKKPRELQLEIDRRGKTIETLRDLNRRQALYIETLLELLRNAKISMPAFSELDYTPQNEVAPPLDAHREGSLDGQ